MQDIRECCQGISRQRLTVMKLHNDVKELMEWKEDKTKQWTDPEKKCIQSYIDDKKSTIEYLVKRIQEQKTCCLVLSKIVSDDSE